MILGSIKYIILYHLYGTDSSVKPIKHYPALVCVLTNDNYPLQKMPSLCKKKQHSLCYAVSLLKLLGLSYWFFFEPKLYRLTDFFLQKSHI